MNVAASSGIGLSAPAFMPSACRSVARHPTIRWLNGGTQNAPAPAPVEHAPAAAAPPADPAAEQAEVAAMDDDEVVAASPEALSPEPGSPSCMNTA